MPIMNSIDSIHAYVSQSSTAVLFDPMCFVMDRMLHVDDTAVARSNITWTIIHQRITVSSPITIDAIAHIIRPIHLTIQEKEF
jgi:hypothetical protein